MSLDAFWLPNSNTVILMNWENDVENLLNVNEEQNSLDLILVSSPLDLVKIFPYACYQ